MFVRYFTTSSFKTPPGPAASPERASAIGRRLVLLLVLGGLLLTGAACRQATPVAPPSDARVDLVDDLATADVRGVRGRLRLADPEARTHLLAGFSFLEQDHSGAYMWAVGETSDLEVFLPRPQGFRLVVHARPFQPEGAPDQRVSLEVNGKSVGRHTVDPTADRFTLAVPRRFTRLGANLLRLRFEQPARPVDWLPESRDRRALTLQVSSFELDAWDEPCRPGRLQAPGGTAYGVDMGYGCRAAWVLPIEAGDRLVIAPLDEGERGAEHLEGVLTLSTTAGLLESRTFDADIGLDLPMNVEVAGAEVQVELWARRRAPGFWRSEPEPGARILWSVDLVGDRPSLADGGSRADQPPELGGREPDAGEPDAGEPGTQELGVLSASTTEEAPAKPDILIYVIDTLRADRLGVYGNPRGLTPHFDALAADGVTFLQARAQTSWTRTAMASLMTGLYPQTHGVNDRDDGLAGDVETLAESLSAAGYRTVAAITNGNVDSRFGMGQGFEVYQYLRERSEDVDFHVLSDEVDDWLALWLTTVDEDPASAERRPFLLYAHVTDPHAPYTPKEPFLSRFAPDADLELGLLASVRAIDTGELPAGEEEAAHLAALYDAEVAFTDFHFGRLIQRLKDMGLYDDMAILVVSDHGEEFFEHGNWEHGETLFEEQLRVPFILKLPRSEAAGTTLDVRAGHVDVLPTLTALAGAAPPEVDGRSLLPAVRGEDAIGGAPSLAYLALETKQMRSLVEDDRKLIVDSLSIDRLYDLSEDPGEQSNLASEKRFRRSALAQALRSLEWQLAAAGREADQVEIDPELRKQLEALGYIQ